MTWLQKISALNIRGLTSIITREIVEWVKYGIAHKLERVTLSHNFNLKQKADDTQTTIFREMKLPPNIDMKILVTLELGSEFIHAKGARGESIGNDYIGIDIGVNPDRRDIQDLIPKIRNSVAHELEHVNLNRQKMQQDSLGRPIGKLTRSEDEVERLIAYATSPVEVDAMVRGMREIARSSKTDFYQAALDHLTSACRRRMFTEQETQRVLKAVLPIWTQTAQIRGYR